MKYTVKKLAHAAGVSVRTLHHYDAIGLLSPAGIENNGYRYYGEEELLRLQQIMFFRELEFPLSKIKQILGAPDFNNLEALESHRAVLLKQKTRLSALIKTIDITIINTKKGVTMNANDMYDGFTKAQMEAYQKEAEERWGNTDAYKQSVARTKTWSKTKRKAVLEEGQNIEVKLARLIDREVSDPQVQELVATHRANIAHFYDVTDEIYRGLAEMYVADPRFAKHYNDVKAGLADFLSQAMLASLKH